MPHAQLLFLMHDIGSVLVFQGSIVDPVHLKGRSGQAALDARLREAKSGNCTGLGLRGGGLTANKRGSYLIYAHVALPQPELP